MATLSVSAFKSLLPPQTYRNARAALTSNFPGRAALFRLIAGSDLRTLAQLYGSDKWGRHWYAQHYETHFRHLRKRPLNVLEIGIGGYDRPEAGGGSLRMWQTYFPNARIYGIDIHDKSAHDAPRIKTFKGSQVDPDFLKSIVRAVGPIDIVIDDGSHVNEHVIFTFKHLFPHLSPNGIYAIEDLQTAYWPNHGGANPPASTGTSLGFLKTLVDGLHYAEFEDPSYQPTETDLHITGLHFYHNLAFIQKGLNNEAGNIGK